MGRPQGWVGVAPPLMRNHQWAHRHAAPPGCLCLLQAASQMSLTCGPMTCGPSRTRPMATRVRLWALPLRRRIPCAPAAPPCTFAAALRHMLLTHLPLALQASLQLA